jgi:Kdo2-lipid IVA lauroyltransferase/acyltransferase
VSHSLRHRAEDALCAAVFGIAGRVPRSAMLALGTTVGTLGYYLDRERRHIALDNLARAYGSALSPREMRRIARGSFQHFARIILDTVACSRLPRETLTSLVEYEGLDIIRQAYAQERGVLLFSGHFGHWELTALLLGWLGLPLTMVTRPLDNPLLEVRLARERSRSGNRVVHRRNAVREILRALRDRSGVALLIDQDARREGIFVPFFGRPASTIPTVALLALRTGAPVVPTYSVPIDRERYRIVFEPPVPIVATADLDADVARLTAEFTAILERWIRQRPEAWLWIHRRWKRQPPAVAPPTTC